jgi:hypothetical protein
VALRAVTALTTFAVAILLALAVPVSQLQTVAVTQSCCCPDPSRCHCPDHEPTKGTQSSIRACHRSVEIVVAPTMPASTGPVIALAPVPARVVWFPVHVLPQPHAAPIPARPAGPS